MRKFLLGVLVSVAAIPLTQFPDSAWGLDAPHNNTNNIQCMSCHSAHTSSTVGYLLTTGTTMESFCQSCHNGVRAPYEVGHSTTSTSSSYTFNKTCTDCHDPHAQDQWRSNPAQALLFTSTVGSLAPCRVTASGNPGWPANYWNDFTLTFQGNPPPSNALSSQVATSFKITGTTGGNTLWVKITDTCSTTYTPNTLQYWGSAGSNFNILYGRLVLDKIAGAAAPTTTVYFFTQTISGNIRNTLSDNTAPYYDEVCNTCHSQTQHHQFDGTAPGGQSHNDGTYCITCHPHDKGFAPQESTGGQNCITCHSDLFTAMNDNTATSYHHFITTTTAAYPVLAQPVTLGTQTDTNRRCLMCHADHNLFRPDINTTSGGRGKNLRASISVAPTTTTGGSFTNTDYISGDPSVWSGGICQSCHNSVQYKSYTQPDDSRPPGSAWTPEIPFTGTVTAQVPAYDQSAHQYTATSYFSGSLMTGTAMDCVKCHNDTLNPKSDKQAQKSAIKFGLHDSTLRHLLSPFTLATYTDPLEENFCYVCHSGGTAGNDFYGVRSMSLNARSIPLEFSRAYVHPITVTRGYHYFTEGTASNWNPAARRHVQCEDCHNPHSSTAGLHVSGTNQAGPPVLGAWGVITSSTISTSFTNSGNTRFTNGSTSVTGSGTNWLTSMAGWMIRNYDDPAGTWYPVSAVGTTTSLTLAVNYTGPTTPASPYPGNPYIMVPNATFTRVDPVSYEASICFKCHTWYAYGTSPPMIPAQAPTTPFGTYQYRPETDLALDFTTTNYGYHPVWGIGKNQPPAGANTNWGTTSCADGSAGKRKLPDGTCVNTLSNTFVDGWYMTSTVVCSDCHGSSTVTDPAGPHGSANRWILTSADPNVAVTIRAGTVTYPNKVAVGTGTSATATPAIFCYNCHRRDVYGDYGLSGNATNAVLSRINHDPSNNSNTFNSGSNNVWGIVCMHCHGGDTIGGMHGSNKRKGPNVDPTSTSTSGGTPGSYSGKRLLNGATWFAVTRATTGAGVACWTKTNADAVSNCRHSHTGTTGDTANYSYDDSPDP